MDYCSVFLDSIHMKSSLFLLSSILLVTLSCSVSEDYAISLKDDSSIKVAAPDGSSLVYLPSFMVIHSEKNPNKKLRRGDFAFEKDEYNKDGLLYNVPTWGVPDNFVVDKTLHVEDGFNPEYDRAYGKGRTANYFLAGNLDVVTAVSAEMIQDKIVWSFPENDLYELKAEVSVDGKYAYPKLSFTFIPKKDGWYSIGYSGARSADIDQVQEIWQPQIWTEKRFPNVPFLSESFRLPVPGTMMTASDVTNGVFADPSYVPFTNLTPTSMSSEYGAMIRNVRGEAQSLLFAPVLGNEDSRMKAGDRYEFDMYLFHKKADILESYQEIAYDMCGFHDYRKNTTANLNTTINNMIDFVQSPYAMFIDTLKGFNYSTDVPGAVKNISGLHLLETALLTDNEHIFSRMARPMFEYGLSRERFLFSTNDKVKGQGTSSRLDGPGVPPTDLLATYIYSGNKIDHMLLEARKLYENKVVKSLNLGSYTFEDRWINSLYLYKATGEKKYLDQAVRDCDEYLKTRVDVMQEKFDDKYSIGWFFWTSYTSQWMELLQMYDATGYERYLDAAEDGAMRYAQFCWMLPVIPEGCITVNPGNDVPVYSYRNDPLKYKFMKAPEAQVEAWRLSEIGLTPESSGTSAGHRAIFMAHHAPFMMRISALTGNRFLHDIARSAIVGRYECFPGYHINTGRTNIYEDARFAYRPQSELNAHTSIHYNHIPSFLAMLWDYLFSDFYYLSDRMIDFPYEYSEGYAYCRSLVYGGKAGRFYDEEDIMPYMPVGILDISDNNINYLTGYGNGRLCVALSCQCNEDKEVTVEFNQELSAIDPAKKYDCKVWRQNEPAGTAVIADGCITLPVNAKGITAICIEGVDVRTGFLNNVVSYSSDKWTVNHTSVGLDDDRAVLFDFGKNLKSVYVWNEANNSRYNEVTLHYIIDNQPQKSMEKMDYPFEYTVELPDSADRFTYWFEAVKTDGTTVLSDRGTLSRN